MTDYNQIYIRYMFKQLVELKFIFIFVILELVESGH